MKLSAQDADLYYRLSLAVLSHTNRKLKLCPGAETPEGINKLPLDERVIIRSALWDELDLLESFLNENPYRMSGEEMKIVGSWKHLVRGRFILVCHLKSHSIFLKEDEKIAYGVLALRDDFETVLGPDLPILLETVLLPFKDRIIYDGLMSAYRIGFGRGFRAGIKDSYQQAKAKYGIVTSLPFSGESRGQSDEELLRFYLKTRQNRDRYWEDIWGLIGKKPALRLLYHQEMGKVHARHYKKKFNEIGISKGWFAVLEGMVVASGGTRDEAEQAMKKIVPSEKRAWVYYFQSGK
ncbi:MAG: hypothetical protein ABSF52_13830 [Syntrophobacteraceae bacterium]|jgi:hypothetical protein